jgi:hypothetical protein
MNRYGMGTKVVRPISGTHVQCVGDRILHTICCSRTMDLGLHIAVHARKKSFLRHTACTAYFGSISGKDGLTPNASRSDPGLHKNCSPRISGLVIVPFVPEKGPEARSLASSPNGPDTLTNDFFVNLLDSPRPRRAPPHRAERHPARAKFTAPRLEE